MTVQLTKHFYDLIKKAMADDFVEYQVQTEAEAIKWAKERLDDIPPSVTIDDVEKARDTITKTVLYAGEGAMFKSAIAVTQMLYAVAVAMQERENEKARAERSSMPRSGASTQTSDHATGEGRVFPVGDSRQGYPVVGNWRTSYDGHTRWIKIGKPDPDKAAGIFDAGGGVRVHTVDGWIFAVEIMDEPGK